jgi:hypothetical protein
MYPENPVFLSRFLSCERTLFSASLRLCAIISYVTMFKSRRNLALVEQSVGKMKQNSPAVRFRCRAVQLSIYLFPAVELVRKAILVSDLTF